MGSVAVRFLGNCRGLRAIFEWRACGIGGFILGDKGVHLGDSVRYMSDLNVVDPGDKNSGSRM